MDHFLKTKKEHKKLKKWEIQLEMTHGDFKNLPRRTASDKVHDKAFNVAKNPKDNNNIWGADLADMQLISKFRKRFLLCVINIYSNYALVVP